VYGRANEVVAKKDACVIAKIFVVVKKGSLEKEKSGIEKEYIYVSDSTTNFSF